MNQSFEATLAQVQGLRTDLQLTKRKVLFELFVSSFATILFVLSLLWLLLQPSVPFKAGMFPVTPTILILPMLINVMMWTIWVALSVLQSTGSSWSDVGGRYSDDDDVRSLYKEYELLRYSLFRARRIEQMIDMLTALAFMTISVTLTFLIIAAAKFM